MLMYIPSLFKSNIYRDLRCLVAALNRKFIYSDELCLHPKSRWLPSSLVGSIWIGCGFRLSFQQSREDEAVLFEMVPKFGRILPLHVLRSNTGRRFHIARN